jgi:hypothetical protein
MDFVWIANDQGDITGVTATSPLTGGGTSGAITIGILSGTTSNLGAVQLSTSTSSTSTSLAATASAVKSAYDLADAAIPKSTVTAKGSIVAATASSTPANLSVGTQNQVLTADSTAATGLRWASGAWITWTPTIGNISIGNGTLIARYQQTGNTVNFSLKITFGTTTTISGSPNFVLPITANSIATFPCYLLDAGVAAYLANAYCPSGSSVYLDLIDTTSSRALLTSFSSTSPFTWGNGDIISISGSYEVA